MVNEQGQMEGAGGFISREYGVGGAETLKEQAAVAGGFLAGKSFEEMGIEAQMATSANPYAYRRELREAQVLRESGETVSPLSHPISATVDYIAKSFRDMFN
jgi:hypothetical protein